MCPLVSACVCVCPLVSACVCVCPLVYAYVCLCLLVSCVCLCLRRPCGVFILAAYGADVYAAMSLTELCEMERWLVDGLSGNV